jgi:small subunit ribosomal protein S1
MSLHSPRPPAAEIFSAEDFAQALAAQSLDFRPGQVVRGRIFQHQSDGVLVDIGAKSPAFLPLKEAGIGSEEDLSQVFPLKSEAEFLILREDAEGQILLSVRRLRLKRLWEELAEKQARGEVVTAPVIGINKGGVVVDVQGLCGFIPRSHLLQREALEESSGPIPHCQFAGGQPRSQQAGALPASGPTSGELGGAIPPAKWCGARSAPSSPLASL